MSVDMAVAVAERHAGSLTTADLLLSGSELGSRLVEATTDRQWLDAFLLAAGLLQLTDDALHQDVLMLRRASSFLATRRGATAHAAGRSAAAMGSGLDLGFRSSRRGAALLAARGALSGLTTSLAGRVMRATQDTGLAADAVEEALPRDAAALVQKASTMVGSAIVRLPACFHSFDLHPRDVSWLVDAYLAQFGGRTPVCVLGVRTSGSYLAPLLAAGLAARGLGEVQWATHRPGRPLHPWERDLLHTVVAAGGRVIVVDDPPVTGRSIAATLAEVSRCGVPVAQVTLVLSQFGDDAALPPALEGWSAVRQPWSEWDVHRRLDPGLVGPTLNRMLGAGLRVDRCDRLLDSERGSRRGHVEARYSVDLTVLASGDVHSLDLLVEGSGLGYLGRQALAVARALTGLVPTVFGFEDGLLFMEETEGTGTGYGTGYGSGYGAGRADAIAGYAAARARALPVPRDPTGLMRGRQPVWEVAAELLSLPFGPLSPAVRPVLLEPLTRRLLAPEQPSVVDGWTCPDRWRKSPDGSGRWVKTAFHQRAFSNLELACYDPVFDLAGAAGDPDSQGFEARLRAAYERTTGETVDGERWLLYRLTQLWRHGRAGELSRAQVQRSSAAAVHEYLAAAYLTDLAPAEGPLCAIDLDGVLETDRLGYPATTPIGVLALRALVSHGYQPVLVTGRSLTAVRDRCRTFRLAGAVAEYGTVLYDHHAGRATDLRTPEERRLLQQARAELRWVGASLDEEYQHGVRARLDGAPVPPHVLAALPAVSRPGLTVVAGERQTDVTVSRLDKGTGLRDLVAAMAAPGCALAVGDAAPDLPMLATAELARSPRNASGPVRAAGVQLTRRAYQSGLAEACADLLGHQVGGCPTCRPPRPSARTRAVLRALAIPEGGRGGVPLRTLRLAVDSLGSRRW